MDLQSPSVLAQLPRPLHAATGKTRIGDVNSLADAKKRKRYELAVAVDGEAVNIYNVWSCDTALYSISCLLFFTIDSNSQACDILRCPAAVHIFLSSLFRAPQAAQKVSRQETDLHRCYET